MRSVRYLGAAIGLLLVVHPLEVRANHDPDITDDEAKCQVGTSLAVGKFITEKAKCIIKCQQGARKTLNSVADCSTPFANTTLTCVQRAETKAEDLEQSKCAKDCPECFTGGDCVADSNARVADAEDQVDVLVPSVYCDDSLSGDGLTAGEAKCQDTVAKTLSNFAAKKLKCYANCRKDEHKSKTPVGACNPPPTDMKASECINKEETKAAFLIDKKCDPLVNPKAEKPECYLAATGTSWAGLVEVAVDQGQPGLYCGSPSGAFLDSVSR